MYTGVVHLVSSNPLHGKTMKKTTPPFFCTNLLANKKRTVNFHPSNQPSISLSCNASSRNNDKTTPEFSEITPKANKLNGDSTEILSSKNGRSNSQNPKSVNQELRKILAKYFPLMQEAAEKKTVNNSRNYGNYVSKSAREKIDESKRDAFIKLLELVKSSGPEKKKNVNVGSEPSGNVDNIDNETYVKKFFEYDGTGTESEESGSESEENDDLLIDDLLAESDSAPVGSDSVLVESEPVRFESESVPVPVKSRPKSSFLKRSPIPEVKYEPIVAKKRNEKEGSESVFYEPVSLDDSDDSDEEILDLGSGILVEDQNRDLDSRILVEVENRDLDSRILKEEESRDLGSGKSQDLGSLKIVELREIAKERGMKGYSKMKKAELVEQLSLLS